MTSHTNININMATDFVLFKCVYECDGGVRRVQVPSSDFEVARDVLASTYGKSPHIFTLAYDDDEGERCSVTCQSEWDEARAISGSLGKILKVFMTDKKPAPAPAPALSPAHSKPTPHHDREQDQEQEQEQEQERHRQREREEKREAKAAHKLAKNAQREEEHARKEAHKQERKQLKQQLKEEKQAEKQQHKHMKQLHKEMSELQTDTKATTTTTTTSTTAPASTSTVPMLDPSSPVLTHVIAPLDNLLSLLSDPVFVTVSQQVVTIGLQRLVDNESFTAALDGMAVALSNTPLSTHAPVSSLLAHFRPIAQRQDDKLRYKMKKRFTHDHAKKALQLCIQRTHGIPESIPFMIPTLTDLRQRVVSTCDMSPVWEALVAIMNHPVVAPLVDSAHIDTHRAVRKIMKHVFQCRTGGGHGHGHGWLHGLRHMGQALWGQHGRHAHHGRHHGHRHGHGHGHGYHTWGGWGKWGLSPTPAPAPAPAAAAAPAPAPAPARTSVPPPSCDSVEPGSGSVPVSVSLPDSVLPHLSPSFMCDGCNMGPIHGIRYSCTVCEDCDLCDKCEASGVHPQSHPLIKIKSTGPHALTAHPPFGPPHPFGPPPPPPYSAFGHPFPYHPFPHPHGPPPPFHHAPHGHGADSFWGPRGHGHSSRHWRSESEVSDMSSLSGTGTGAGTGTDSADFPPRAYLVRHANYPDRAVVAPDTVFVKTWVVHNSGDSPWPDTTRLMFKRGARELLSGPGVEFPVVRAVPGTSVDVSVPLRTPSLPGRYTAYFRLVDTATQHPFGPKVWCDIQVVPNTDKCTQAVEKAETHGHETDSAIGPGASTGILPPAVTPLASACPVSVSVYPIQMNALIGMGFTDSALNESVLAIHGGNLQQAANYLLERITKAKTS